MPVYNHTMKANSPVRDIRIALLLHLESKVDRDRFSGILRFASGRNEWEVRTLTLSDLRATLSASRRDHRALWIPDGIITDFEPAVFADYHRFCSRLARRHIPCILLDADPASKYRVDGEIQTDDRAIGTLAAEFFVKKGFLSFAFINTYEQSELWHSRLRGEAFVRTLKRSGQKAIVIDLIDPLNKNAVSLTQTADKLKKLPLPCGVFVYSDEISRHVLDACRHAGLKVPEQLSILGVDDQVEISENTKPPLSSILPDFENSGHAAAALMDQALLGRARRHRRLLTPVIGITERASTQDIRGGSRLVAAADRYIRLHLAEPMHLSDIAKALNVSPRLIELRFKETLGCSVLEKILDLRIEKAKQLVERTTLPFSQIAYSCGYTTPDGLQLAFRKRLGTTMSNWRSRFST